MSKNPLKLKIAYLCPDILQGFCDKANIDVFIQRAKERNIEISLNEIYANDRVQASKYDFYYIGGSNTQALEDALKFLKRNEEELKIAAYSNVPMLAINCGYQLFGNSYQLHNQAKVEGIKIFDIETYTGKNLHYGSLIGVCPFLRNKTIVGFENHGMVTILKSGVAPFLILQKGKGNNGKDKTEGARFNNVIGSYLTSPILAQNPHLCDFFIAVALRIKYKCKIPLTSLCDDIEWYSHNFILEAK